MSLLTLLFYFFLSSRIPHLESGHVAVPSLFQKPSLTGVTSFEADVSVVFGSRFEKVRNSHGFENLKNEVQMSVISKTDRNLRIGRRLEVGRRSESCTCTNIKWILR